MPNSSTSLTKVGPVKISVKLPNGNMCFDANSEKFTREGKISSEDLINYRSSTTSKYNAYHVFGKEVSDSQYHFIEPNEESNKLVLSKELNNVPSATEIEKDKRAFKLVNVIQSNAWCLKHCASGKYVTTKRNNYEMLLRDDSIALDIDIIEQKKSNSN